MKTIKILNTHACLGGNRALWNDSAYFANIYLDITAVENDPELAKMYKERFRGDKVIIADAREYLKNHYKEFDIIWMSPPCPSHSRARFWSSKGGKYGVEYPDLSLYEYIIFLDNFFDGKWVVENVIPYYKPLIEPSQEIDRHLYWSNFKIPKKDFESAGVCQGSNEFSRLCEFHNIEDDWVKSYKGKQNKVKIVRNMVDANVGQYIFDIALGIHKQNTEEQGKLF